MIALDSSVLIDLLADGPQADAAEACLRQCLSAGPAPRRNQPIDNAWAS